MERKTFAKFCECTEEDWECDLGFHRDEEGNCVSNLFMEVDYTPPAECEDYYSVTLGYRKVAGNQCQEGIEHNPLRIPCPRFNFFRFRNVTFRLPNIV
jgi:hypothetical protein